MEVTTLVALLTALKCLYFESWNLNSDCFLASICTYQKINIMKPLLEREVHPSPPFVRAQVGGHLLPCGCLEGRVMHVLNSCPLLSPLFPLFVCKCVCVLEVGSTVHPPSFLLTCHRTPSTSCHGG